MTDKPRFFIHQVYREDCSDPYWPEFWWEYRVALTEEQPEKEAALFSGDGESGLKDALRFIEEAGGTPRLLD